MPEIKFVNNFTNFIKLKQIQGMIHTIINFTPGKFDVKLLLFLYVFCDYQ